MTAAILLLTAALAAANGSNDDAKGVATLGGSGVATYRKALALGVLATAAGASLSLLLAGGMVKLFSKGIVSQAPSPAFALAVLTGATAWVAIATLTRLPVSTTHAIVGALVGAGVLLGSGAVQWIALATKVAVPLFASALVAYVASAIAGRLTSRIPECVCISAASVAPAGGALGVVTAQGGAAASALAPIAPQLRPMEVRTGTVAQCRVHAERGRVRFAFGMDALHWLSAGATSFARGLNDTPKIVAIGAFALLPAGMPLGAVLAVVSIAMAAAGSRRPPASAGALETTWSRWAQRPAQPRTPSPGRSSARARCKASRCR